MNELPLFPLHTVLFPGMPLNLHIFEERYKEMIGLCLEQERPFGVVLIRSGQEALGPLARPHRVGCTARITEVQPLSEGRMNLTAFGQERFRIISLSHARPYLVGLVEPYPLEAGNPQTFAQSGRRLHPWIIRYLEILARAGDLKFEAPLLPDEPLVLAYLAATLLQVPPAEKQVLLEEEGAAGLLSDLRAIYRREVALLGAMLSQTSARQAGPFSPS